uniref:CUB domain-containing protein n=1 Tax=Macrostomum lignano TaxID=282301 RepID=A0A1I8JR65_9PLAT
HGRGFAGRASTISNSIMHYARSTIRHLAEPGRYAAACSAAAEAQHRPAVLHLIRVTSAHVHKLYGWQKVRRLRCLQGSRRVRVGGRGRRQLSSAAAAAAAVRGSLRMADLGKRRGRKLQNRHQPQLVNIPRPSGTERPASPLFVPGRFCGSLTPRSVTSNSSRVAYRGDKECIWKIEVPNGYSVALKFFSFEFIDPPAAETHTQCVYDFVEVLEAGRRTAYRWASSAARRSEAGEEHRQPDDGAVQVGQLRQTRLALRPPSRRSTMSAWPLHGGQQHGCQHICVNTLGGYHCDCRPGFHLHRDGRTCEDTCGGTLVAMRGSVTSPSYPDKYPPNKHCKWHIIAPIGHKILLNFTAFDIEGRDRCEYDYLDIFDGVDEATSKRIGRYCGDQPPESITSENNTMKISFISDGTVSSRRCLPVQEHHRLLRVRLPHGYGYVLYGNHQCKEGGCKHRITRLSGEFSSPNYPRSTRWKSVQLELPHHAGAPHQTDPRRSPMPPRERIGVFCGDAMPPTPVISTGNSMFVGFVSDSSLQRRLQCGSLFNLRRAADRLVRERELLQPRRLRDKDYGTRENCNWTLTTSNPEEVIVLNMETFELESEIECA